MSATFIRLVMVAIVLSIGADASKRSDAKASMERDGPQRFAPLPAERERALAPQDGFQECSDCPQMIVVPAGSFVMGSPPGERDRAPAEGPQLSVSIARPFALGRTHVTVDQYAAFVAATGHVPQRGCWTIEGGTFVFRDGLSWRDPGFSQGGTHPALCVSWDDATNYVAWLSRTTGRTYRLPSEAEWEYAARAGSTSRYFFGDDPHDLCRHANGFDRTARSAFSGFSEWTPVPCDDGYVNTAPAGSFSPNLFGLYDMHGNAYELVEDCYHQTMDGVPPDGSARGQAHWWSFRTCKHHVRRGGSWYGSPADLRAARRLSIPHDVRGTGVGFRIARTL